MSSAQSKALLLTIYQKKNKNREDWPASFQELKLLSLTDGLDVDEMISIGVDSYSAKFLMGEGNVQRIHELIQEKSIPTVVFDNELSPIQIKNLEKRWQISVIDRTDLILDIFSRHASTRESELQVQLARLEHLLPRLSGQWTHLDRQYGGIKVRGGGGETQLEIDRRDTKRKISLIKEKLVKVDQNRMNQQKRRSNAFRIALVGYTNAGKSTLLNTLTASHTYADDKLFATLDPRTKKWDILPSQEVLITDTIGFIRRLPHHLIASFKSTLLEAEFADLIWMVIDYSHPEYKRQIEIVEQTLKEIGLDKKNIWKIYNKIDMITPGWIAPDPEGIYVSALSGYGLDQLKNRIREICGLLKPGSDKPVPLA